MRGAPDPFSPCIPARSRTFVAFDFCLVIIAKSSTHVSYSFQYSSMKLMVHEYLEYGWIAGSGYWIRPRPGCGCSSLKAGEARGYGR